MSPRKIPRNQLDRAEQVVDEQYAKVKANIAKLRGDQRAERAEMAELACKLREEWAPVEDEPDTAVGFYWWQSGHYRVVILRRGLKRDRREKPEAHSQRKCFELRAPTPEELIELASAIGWDLGGADKVRRDCESSTHGERR